MSIPSSPGIRTSTSATSGSSWRMRVERERPVTLLGVDDLAGVPERPDDALAVDRMVVDDDQVERGHQFTSANRSAAASAMTAPAAARATVR